MAAKYVRPYSKGQKNDFKDAEAIAEAVQRPTMRFVAIKTIEQLDLQALHRIRARLVSQRTGAINQIRAFMWAWRPVSARTTWRLDRPRLSREGVGEDHVLIEVIDGSQRLGVDVLVADTVLVQQSANADVLRMDRRIFGVE